MEPAEVMLSGFIGVVADSFRPLYSTSGFRLYNSTVSANFYFQINKLYQAKYYIFLQDNLCSNATNSSTWFFLNQKISSSKKIAIGGKFHA